MAAPPVVEPPVVTPPVVTPPVVEPPVVTPPVVEPPVVEPPVEEPVEGLRVNTGDVDASPVWIAGLISLLTFGVGGYLLHRNRKTQNVE